MLSKRQREIFDFVVAYADKHGYPPTVREIGESVGLASPSTVHAHLANLERAGYLKRDPTKPRALEVVGRERAEAVGASPAHHAARLPLIGEIAAGGPLLAATVKRFFRENGRIRLQPENSALSPLYPGHVQILGKVTGVYRTLR